MTAEHRDVQEGPEVRGREGRDSGWTLDNVGFRAGSREKVLAKVTRRTRAEQRHRSEEGGGCAGPAAGARGTQDLDPAGDERTHSRPSGGRQLDL